MITNDQLLKLFVRVPDTVKNFNGASVSGAQNEIRLFFEERTGLIWAKGKSYGITAAQATALSTLIGSDTNKSVRDIVAEVIGLESDANTVIDRLKEVLDWFNNVSETETGAALIADVAAAKTAIGAQATYYTAQEAADYNTEHSLQEDDEGYVSAGDVKTPATGLYAYIDSHKPQGYDELVTTVGNNTAAIATNTAAIGSKAVLYTSSEAIAANAQLEGAVSEGAEVPADFATKVGSAAAGTNLTAEEAAAYNATLTGAVKAGDIKNESSGLYKYVDDNVKAATPEGFSQMVSDVNGLKTRVTALEAFDPWENYVAPVTPSEDPEPEP